MRHTFIEESVRELYNRFGVELSDVEIILPSKRATLFFNRAISGVISEKRTPIWQPAYSSLSELFGSLSTLQVADRLKLLATLYSIYSNFHKNESFDSFYYWGDMLLNDFEAIDNYMVNAERVFSNSGDLREIEHRFDYITEEDGEEIARFWRNFNNARSSEEKDYFYNIWHTLHTIYSQFKDKLRSEGIGYQGMIARDVAEGLINGTLTIAKDKKYAVIGFNALSNTEKILLDHLKKGDNTLFFWDSDSYFLSSNSNEAGLFIRKNIERYGESNAIKKDNYLSHKDITVIKSPSKSIESRYVWNFLEKCQEGGKVLGAETAIILTDESLLSSVVNAIPPSIEHINITCGYSLGLTTTYNFIETLLSLQTIGSEEFYYKDVNTILGNPFVISAVGCELIAEIKESAGKDKIYYTNTPFASSNLLSRIFAKQRGWRDISNYLLWVINRVAADATDIDKLEKEALYKCYNSINLLSEQIESSQMDISDKIYYSLLRKHIKKQRISYEGEPLVGIQIMGILESRTLDFENVLILSVEEDNFPTKGVGASFIPNNLRDGYGLPTIKQHQSIYAYYFYRLLQRAKRVDISYVSTSDETSSGEPTRYIYQLQYTEPHNIKYEVLSVDLSLRATPREPIAKDDRAKEYITNLRKGRKVLSPSSFHDYVECPVRFFYKKVLQLTDLEDSREREFGALERGNTLHKSIEQLYTPLLKMAHRDTISQLRKITIESIEKAVNSSIEEWLGESDSDISADIYYGKRSLVREIKNIIDYDINRPAPFSIIGLEHVVKNRNISGIRFYGEIDRIDMIDGGGYMIIDYKTGKSRAVKELAHLLDSDSPKSKPYLQSLIYCYLYSEEVGTKVTPALYHVGEMGQKDYSPLLHFTSNNLTVTDFEVVREQFSSEMESKLSELTDLNTPFTHTTDVKMCDYCDYKSICK